MSHFRPCERETPYLRFRQFLLRGLEAVRGDSSLVTMAWNIGRMAVLKG